MLGALLIVAALALIASSPRSLRRPLPIVVALALISATTTAATLPAPLPRLESTTPALDLAACALAADQAPGREGRIHALGDRVSSFKSASKEKGLPDQNCTLGFRLFLQVDPSGYADSPNLYAGFANDPVNNRDPTGMVACGMFDSPEECRAKIRAGNDADARRVRLTGRSRHRDHDKVFTLGLLGTAAAPVAASMSVPAAGAMGTAGAYGGTAIGLGLSAGIATPLVAGAALITGSPADADIAVGVVSTAATPGTLLGSTAGAMIAGDEAGYFGGAAVGGGLEGIANLAAFSARALRARRLSGPHLGTGDEAGATSPYNPSGRRDNCVASVCAVARNKGETADDVERLLGHTGRERQLSRKDALDYFQRAGLAPSAKPVPFMSQNAQSGGYAIFAGDEHVVYGLATDDGWRMILDPQTGEVYNWTELVRRYQGGVPYALGGR